MPFSYHSEFLTATILKWQHLLEDDNCKQIIINSFKWLVEEKKCTINAFVIMPNHIHLIWKIADGFKREKVQGAFFSFTAHELKKYLMQNYPDVLQKHYVNDADRNFQFWEREPMVKEFWTKPFFRQKLNYTHFNPCQPHWNLAKLPEHYKWSSASFYVTGNKNFSWLTHFND